MASNAPELIHVNGPCIVKLGPGGKTPPQLERMGVTDEHGATITTEILTEDLHTDFAGGGVPFDVLELGKLCRIEFTLVKFSATIVERFRGGMRGRLGNAVSSRDIGRMALASGRYFELLIESTARTGGVRESPYRFQTLLPTGPQAVNVGSKAGRVRLSGRALPNRGFLWVRS